MKSLKPIYFLNISIFMLLLYLGGLILQCYPNQEINNEDAVVSASQESIPSHTTIPTTHGDTTTPSTQEIITEVSFQAVGDIMMHKPLQVFGLSKNRYQAIFKKIKPDLEKSQLTLGNLEGVVHPKRSISGYPRFNAHPDLLDALKWASFEILNFSNNHTYDQGVEGIQSTLDLLANLKIPVLGVQSKGSDRNTYTIATLNGIKIGMVGYTMVTNGLPMPSGESLPHMNYITYHDVIHQPNIFEALTELKKNTDFLIVSIHWGIEYQPKPTKEQVETAHEILNHGADLIVGHHPHVLQPIEYFKTLDGRNTMVVYSLGNFVSSQNSFISWGSKDAKRAATGDSVLFEARITKKGTHTQLSNTTVTPLWMSIYYDHKHGSVYEIVNIQKEIQRIKDEETSKEWGERLKLLEYRYQIISTMVSHPMGIGNIPMHLP